MARSKHRVIWAASGAAVLGLALILVFSYVAVKVYGNKASAATNISSSGGLLPPPKDTTVPEQVVSPGILSNTFRQIAKSLKPTVVNISVVQKAKANGGEKIPGFDFEMPGSNAPRRGTGSGFVVTSDGYILTNNHVVTKADNIEVKFPDGHKYKAKVVGTDPETDIAVVKIDANNLSPASLGDSDSMEQGDWVVAIGSPFGLEQTITAGIVSAKGRNVGGGTYNNFIQTDASINPGNSGGPLVNMKGEVIGINTMIFSENGGNQGIGFAIPSNQVRTIYNQLVAGGKVTRGYLGVIITEITPENAKGLGLTVSEGALVNDVQPDGPAAKAGIQSGDVIVSFDGKSVKGSRELTNIVAETPVGKKTDLKLIRDGKPQTLTIQTTERKSDVSNDSLLGQGEKNNLSEEASGKLGISASTLNEQQAASLKIKSGVVIEQVVPGGAASEVGLQRGDVIHRINRQTVNSMADLVNGLKSVQSGDTVILQVERKGQSLIFVNITID